MQNGLVLLFQKSNLIKFRWERLGAWPPQLNLAARAIAPMRRSAPMNNIHVL